MNRSNHAANDSKTRAGFLPLLILAAFTLAIYFLTAPRTITWWFGSSYKLAAVTFGIHFPPGSLILTILGWLTAQLPLGISKAFSLNLFASVLATFTCCLTTWLSLHLVQRSRINGGAYRDKMSVILVSVGIGSGCLTLAFSETTWRYAIEFMPYILTAAFTALILWAVLNWWKQNGAKQSYRWLFLIMFLFGLDFSVHRTNLLLLPGLLVWVSLCRPAVLRRIKSWIIGGVGLITGFAFQLLTIPIAARDPIINAGDPSNWSRFYYYVSLQQYGGGWLVNIWPRQASFWDVQVADYLEVFANNFVSYGGILAVVPLLFCLVGMVALWRRDRRLTIGLSILFVFSSLGAVVYFNLPEGFFQPMDRHYLPSFVIFALVFTYGAGATLLYASRMPGKSRTAAVSLVSLLVVAMPVKQLLRNHRLVGAANNFFAHDYASNILNTLQPDAILFVAGDSYSPVSYLQVVENVRPDVIMLSSSLCNVGWYVKQVKSRYPGLPLTLSEEEMEGLGPKAWTETTVPTKVNGEPYSYHLPDGSSLPDTFNLRVPPTVAGRYILAQDWLLVRMIEENQWRRPVYFTSPPAWLHRYTRLEGLVSRLVPQDSVALNAEVLRENLLERYSYRGYRDSSVPIDRYTQLVGHQLAHAFCTLARYELDRGDTAACRRIDRKLNKLIPIDRLEPTPELRREIEELCPPE